MISVSRFQPPAKSSVTRVLRMSMMAIVLSTASVLTGLVPNVSSLLTTGEIRFERTAYAQNISNRELRNYARALIAIEPIRRRAYDAIEEVLGENRVPSIECHRPNTINDLPSDIQDIARDYCEQSIRIVERNNLSIEDFNRITQQVNRQGNGSELHQRLEEILIDLQ